VVNQNREIDEKKPNADRMRRGQSLGAGLFAGGNKRLRKKSTNR